MLASVLVIDRVAPEAGVAVMVPSLEPTVKESVVGEMVKDGPAAAAVL